MKYATLILPVALVMLGACNSDPYKNAIMTRGAALYASKNYTQALPLLREAAQANNPDAQLLLAKSYDFGHGVPANMKEAVKWYTAAANGGNANAQDNLGTCYATGSGVPKNLVKAFSLYNQAAAQNDASALNNLGLCYLNGEGTEADPGMAAECFRRAAKLGNSNGQYNLEQSKQWVKKAALQGHKNATAFMEDNEWI